MKKFIFIILLSFTSLLGYSQILVEDFEAAPDNADASGVWTMTSGNWLVRDNRTNSNPNWRRNTPSNTFPANSGVKAAFIDRENTGIGVLAQEWLCTPQRNITANSQLRFFTRQTLIGDDSSTKFRVLASASADQSDLSAYTILVAEYTETELSTITATQLDYEEKVIDLPFTGLRYFAFVKVTTQPGPSTPGDRWLVDDVKIVEKCIDPTVLLVIPASITATTTKLTWLSSTSTTFDVQYGPTGFILDVPAPNVFTVAVNNNENPRTTTLTGLLPNTGYQYYVRAVCTDSNSNWVGPFNWNTKPLGTSCATPIVVTPLPYSDASNTTIYGNNITNGSPGNATLCGAPAGFLGGNDVVYSYTATDTGNIVITMDPQGATNTGIFVYTSCANIGTTCIAGVGNSGGNVRIIPSVAVTAGQTIYIVISSTTATPNFAYNLNIQNATCPQPTITPMGIVTPTSAEANWVNGLGSAATSWEIAVQDLGAAIPNDAGLTTNDNSNYLITQTFIGDDLVASHQYQYWVRADCGAGLFSPWTGPFPFNTPACLPAQQCNYTFNMTDTGGNGWEGGRMQVIQNGLVVATIGATITNGGPTTVTVPLCTNQPFSLFWSVAGDFPDEIRINIKNNFAQTIYAMTTNSQALIGTTLYSGTVDCLNPLCLQPTANPTVPAATITFNNAVINWNTTGTSATTTTGYGIYVVLQGSPVPDASTVPTYTTTAIGPGPVSFTIPVGDLLPDTNYTVYVQSLCSVNGPSVWTGGTNFKTKEQCPKPTALTTAAINSFGATLGWTNLTGGTNFQILVQLASLPAPAANDPNWVTTTGGAGPTLFSYIATSLLPETQYEFYVRTDCGGGIISNPQGPKAFTTAIACPKPTALTAASIALDPYSYTLGWTNLTGGTNFQILVQLASLPAPATDDPNWVTTTGGVGPTLFSYMATNLIPETQYEFYVRTDCGIVNGLSTLAGPKAFTTIPSCYKPTAFVSVAAGLTAFSVQLQWNSVATTTAWQVLAQLPTDPPPTASTPGWLDTNGGGGPGPVYTFTYPGLTPETAYVFYIRGNCGNIIGSPSTPTGPRAVTTPPSCYKPAALTATSITPFTASLGWTNNVNSPVTEWQISIQAAGSTAPAVSQTGTTITQNAYPATGLTPNTCYDYYVRSVCGGVNGLSTWAGPFNFCTPPTCPQPTNLGAANSNDPTATLSWTEPGTATNWDLVYQAPSGPVPGPGTVGIPLTATTFTTPTLDPGFYEYYVRSHCSDTDQSFWTGPFNFFIALPPAVCASVEINVATTSPGVIDLCPGLNCVDLAAEFTDSKDTSTYTVLPTVFAPPFPFTGGTQLPVNTDDVWSAPFTLPFNFCFYGVNYPTVYVGSNGVLTFTAPDPNAGCPWNTDPAVNLPNPAFPILNAIYGPYQDINPAVDTSPIVRSINYQILGVAPCRAFVVNYYNVGQFSCGTSVGLQTSQMVLYETSNIIEVYVQDRTVCPGWNEGSGVIGIQNLDGTLAHFPPDRNLGPWEAHNEAWRFTPNGNSNVVFSWLKGGAFYSNAPTINVCVSETTNMTAQAVYTGCGGQITTKTEDVLLRINEVIIPPMPNVVACQSYVLPALTVGNYFNQPGGLDPITDTTITGLGLHTIYVYAQTTSVPACDYEISFTVDIQDVLVAPVLPPVTACVNYVLPALDVPFNYYTGAAGTGTMYSGSGGDTISSTQTLNIYGQSGLCTAESQLSITIDPAVVLAVQNSVSDCNNFTLPVLPVNNTYYTATGGPNGTGTIINPATVISENQTIYIYAQSGTCSEEGSFTVSIFGIDPPTVTITQPTCLTPTGTIEVTSPLNPTGGTLASNLFISEVTDQPSGAPSPSLSYVEIFNGTGSPVDLSNYKLKVYTNGNATANCDQPLSGTIANNTTKIIKLSTDPNQGGVSPDLIPGCTGVNTDDSIVLTTSTDAVVDVWGINGTDFTPLNAAGYDYRRNTTATAPSTTWNPADWTVVDWNATDPRDYSDVGFYPIVSSNVYQYNIDNGPWQFTTTFSPVAVGQHTITAQDIITGCTNSLVVNITPDFVNSPVTGFTYTTPVCNSDANQSPLPVANFTTGGTYTADSNLLLINATTGEINTAGSAAGNYVVTYTVAADLANCISAGHTDFPITINAIRVPDFAEFTPFCPGAVVPILADHSPNGIAGSWVPAAIDNQTVGNQVYTFHATPGQCASDRQYNIVISTPTIVPTFNAIADFCSGATSIPTLPTTSNNIIAGSWLPATINNTQTGNYVFTPNPGQCALPKTITVTVNPIEQSDFIDTVTFCAGTTAPVLQTNAPNGIVGTWSPNIITQAGSYVFTPTPVTGRCFDTQTITVSVGAKPVFDVIGGCLNGNYTLTVTSETTDLQTAHFVWRDNGGNIVPGATSSTLEIAQPGNYTAEVTDLAGCFESDVFNATTISCSIQKGISPKGSGTGDGLNDYFDLEGQNVTKLEIFNRYGSKVYSKSNYSKEWYGQSDSGDELPDGTYFYVIERNGEKSKTGWIYINHEL
ncbi:fibronectin type III domain-containing protein [Flavobacterium sp.]|uniref:fibronectin type III domain-containing protein n=1 Tax=Flavobacterium sp. TaxID=239 RepID=UPI00286C14B6|nr:fibronectin type III domain-containing protein [Flavobacterium sp.]